MSPWAPASAWSRPPLLGMMCGGAATWRAAAGHPHTAATHSRSQQTDGRATDPAEAPRPAPRSPHWPRHRHRRTGTGVGLLHDHISAMSDDVIQSLVLWFFGYLVKPPGSEDLCGQTSQYPIWGGKTCERIGRSLMKHCKIFIYDHSETEKKAQSSMFLKFE